MDRSGLYILFLTITLFTCVKPVDPESFGFEDLLVVEGLLTDEFTQHEILLSRTFKLDEHVRSPERGAEVWIQRSDGTKYNFSETAEGTYTSDDYFSGFRGSLYTLYIKTNDGNIYESEEVELLAANSLDKINAEFERDAGSNEGTFDFYLSAGEEKVHTNYYRWKWIETYQVKAPKPSAMIWNGTDLIRREDARELQICYRYDSSRSILVTASNLESSKVSNFPFRSFHSSTQRLVLRYSIEVTQISISEQSFRFWELIRSNNESQGSLFDKQPGTIVGNIRSVTNPQMKVLGIFEASETSKLRVFYNPGDFNDDGYRLSSDDFVNCSKQDPISLRTFDEIGPFMKAFGDEYLPWYISSGLVDPPGYLFVTKRCGDCREYGEVEKPEFWLD